MHKIATQNTLAEQIAKIIGRTPSDIAEGCGCEELCDKDGGMCICAGIHLPQAQAILAHLRKAGALSDG